MVQDSPLRLEKNNSFPSRDLKTVFVPVTVCQGCGPERWPRGGAEGREPVQALRPAPGCRLLMASSRLCRAAFPTYLMLFSLSATFSGTPDEQTSGFPHSRKAPGGGWLGKPWLSDRCDTRLPPPLSRPPGD